MNENMDDYEILELNKELSQKEINELNNFIKNYEMNEEKKINNIEYIENETIKVYNMFSEINDIIDEQVTSLNKADTNIKVSMENTCNANNDINASKYSVFNFYTSCVIGALSFVVIFLL